MWTSRRMPWVEEGVGQEEAAKNWKLDIISEQLSNQDLYILSRRVRKAQLSILNNVYSNSLSCLSTFIPQKQLKGKGIFF